MYKPLHDSITIKNSAIQGLGLFSTEAIKKDTILGIAHIANPYFPNGYIRTGLGAYYNHSDRPNCKLVDGYLHHMDVKYLMTCADIEADEELTARYSLYTFEVRDD